MSNTLDTTDARRIGERHVTCDDSDRVFCYSVKTCTAIDDFARKIIVADETENVIPAASTEYITPAAADHVIAVGP